MTRSRLPAQEPICHRHRDCDVPFREGNHVSKPRRRECIGEALIDPFSQPDEYCCSEPAGGGRNHAFKIVANPRSKSLERAPSASNHHRASGGGGIDAANPL